MYAGCILCEVSVGRSEFNKKDENAAEQSIGMTTLSDVGGRDSAVLGATAQSTSRPHHLRNFIKNSDSFSTRMGNYQ